MGIHWISIPMHLIHICLHVHENAFYESFNFIEFKLCKENRNSQHDHSLMIE